MLKRSAAFLGISGDGIPVGIASFIVATLVGVGIHYLTGWLSGPGVTLRELFGVWPCGAEGGMLGVMIIPYPIGVIMGIILFGKLSHR